MTNVRIIEDDAKEETELWEGEQFIASWHGTNIFPEEARAKIRMMFNSVFDAGKRARSAEIKKLIY